MENSETLAMEPTAAPKKPVVKTLLFVLLGVVVLLLALGAAWFFFLHIPAGTVKGVLLDPQGKPIQKNSLQLLEITDQVGDQATLKVTAFKAVTNETGAFTFEKVSAAKYAILNLNVTFPLGGAAPQLAQMVIRGNDGKMLAFDVNTVDGLDLGPLTFKK